MTAQYVLLQLGRDPFNANFVDTESRPAFTLSLANNDPNLVIRLTRETVWSSRHPSVMGPDNSYYYFGPSTAPGAGYVMYGANQARISMKMLSRSLRQGSSTRYFTSQSNHDYKWKISPMRMECYSTTASRACLAIWECSRTDEEHDAVLVIFEPGMRIVTEVVTTLILNRMWMELNWPECVVDTSGV